MYAKCRGKVQTVQFIRHAMTPPKRYDHLQTKIKRLETDISAAHYSHRAKINTYNAQQWLGTL